MRDVLWRGEDVIAALGAHLTDAPHADWQAAGLAIDTRDLLSGDIFVALPGARAHGHDYVASAFESGAAAALVENGFDAATLETDAVLLRVDDVLSALETLARAARQRSSAQIIAITGSVGKTGTKASLADALSKSGLVHAAERSFNNHIGVPLSLARLPQNADYGVFELGMNHAGEIAALVDMVRPHCAIITTIAAAHIENFDSMDALAATKAEILSGIETGGSAILPFDNAYFGMLKSKAETHKIKVLSFSAEGHSDADIHISRAKLHATCSCVSAMLETQAIAYKIGAPGIHLVANSLAVLGATQLVGADLALAALSLGEQDGMAGRGARYHLGAEHAPITLIDESYNANPTSMAAALDTLGLMPRKGRGRRIAVLGDMAELGDRAAELHAAMADKTEAADIDLVITCGALMQNLHNALPPGRVGAHAADHQAALAILRDELQQDDVVMVKGSNSSRMGLVVEGLIDRLTETEQQKEAL
ncbi:MAG: UDP-N-acetylmuramoyl-tripeptide--D-alanyl-D-alanine ligase [Alphaproteobacteria bacterium]|nr:UDP-N-acetylmuramoyl-tripeptide--D-alanyl-D-alanine ligase [Alphaproteobacteria bacterium]